MGENSGADVIKSVLREHHISAVQALAVLVGTLIDRHIDCELRKLGRRPAYSPGNERTNSLTAAVDALYQSGAWQRSGDEDDPRNDLRPVNDEVLSGLPPDKLPAVRQALMHLLTTCQFNAEQRAGLLDEDEDAPPVMRLVTD